MRLSDLGRREERDPSQMMNDLMDETPPDYLTGTTQQSTSSRRGRNYDRANDYINHHQRGNTSGSALIDVDGDGIPDVEATPLNEVGEDAIANTHSPTEQSNHQEAHRGGRSGDGINFFQRIILIGLAAVVAYTFGRYAWDSTKQIDVKKIKTDIEENGDLLMGKDITPSEDAVGDLIQAAKDGIYTDEREVPYSLNKKKTSFTFKIENSEITQPTSDYPTVEFQKKNGYVLVQIKYDEDGKLKSFEILGFGIKEE